MAIVLLVAFTLAVAVVIGSWLSSISRQETEIAGEALLTQVNCSKAVLSIIDAVCYNNNSVDIILANLGPIELTNPSVYAKFANGSAFSWSNTVTVSSGNQTKLSNTTHYWNTTSLDEVVVTALCGGASAISAEKTGIGDDCST